MDTLIARISLDLGPIDLDWIIADLLTWLSDDARPHDAALGAPLMLIDAALTGVPWAGRPSPVAVIRSIAHTVRRTPALRHIRIRELDLHLLEHSHFAG